MFENNYIRLHLEENILVGRFKGEAPISLKSAQEIVKLRMDNFNDKSYLLLADVRKLKSVDQEARSYLGSKDGSQNIIACAILIESEVQKVMGNFFFKFNKPSIPSKIFTNYQEATTWLNLFLNGNPN